MPLNLKSVVYASAVALLMVGPALAKEGNNGNHYGWYKGGKGGVVSHSAPGPELGAGLPALLIAGYLWYRRRGKQRNK